MKRFFSSKKYEWYRPEYRRLSNWTFLTIIPLALIACGFGAAAKMAAANLLLHDLLEASGVYFLPRLPGAVAWLSAGLNFALLLMGISGALSITFKLVDEHEKKLAKGKAEAASSKEK